MSRSDNEREEKPRRSRSPKRDGRDRHRGRRSHSRSPSTRDRRSRRDEGNEGRVGGGAVQSKWARHRDQASADDSSADEDRELERTYQSKEKSKPEEEDLFGLDKILS